MITVHVSPLPFATKNMHPLALSAAAPHTHAGTLFIDYVVSKEGQLFIENLGRVISRADIPQEDYARIKLIPEEVAIADRVKQVTEDYKKYLQ